MEISTAEREAAEGILKQWKMDDFQHGRGVFTLSVVSLFGPLLCQEGSQRAQLSIQPGRWQAKNTPLHALWNTLPLFTCLLTPPDLFTRPSRRMEKTHLAENNTCVIIRLRHARPRSSKQKHSKNTRIWLENGLISLACLAVSRRFHLALTQAQREKVVILQLSPPGRLRAAAQVRSNIG